MANLKSTDSVTVIVRRGVLVVDQIVHAIGAEVKLVEAEARRLIGLGVVSPPDTQAATSPPASGVTATSTDGPSVTALQE
ncbi:MAG TPA: hypothetical protein PLD10_22225 [Rhodopila sp.]|nr:hypothetical protein [Rhodopila sp.]